MAYEIKEHGAIVVPIECRSAFLEANGRRIRQFRATRPEIRRSVFDNLFKGMVILFKDYDICWDAYNFIVWAPWFGVVGPEEQPPEYDLFCRGRRIRFGRREGDFEFLGYALVEKGGKI